MFSSFRKTAFIILIIILLPTMIFSIYEIGSMRSNEAMIESIYRNQLDAILFSVNQYSEDVISSWASKLDNLVNDNRHTLQEDLTQFIRETPSVIAVKQYSEQDSLRCVVPDSLKGDLHMKEIDRIITKNDTLIRRLKNYMRGGYRKIEPIALKVADRQLIIFLGRAHSQLVINALEINPRQFITWILDPKIQEITRGQFYISAYHDNDKQPFYNSDKQHRPSMSGPRKHFWLLKNYSLGIELKDRTIADLARSRTQKDVVAIAVIDLLLLLGIWIIIRNVRRQVELAQLKSDFVSNVSHEIRTPLALISMYIETLEMGRVTGENKVKEYYNVILQETRRLSTIVNKILNFSQIEGGKRKYVFSTTDLNVIVDEVYSVFKINLDKLGFQFSIRKDDHLPEFIADREAVVDALVNLVDNAVKYSEDHKEISITTGKINNNVFVEVSDKGIGISSKEQKYIFDKFYRVTEKNLALKAKGSGLGLAIVKHISEAHQGKIEVSSEKGKGSKFRLIFPLKQNNNAARSGLKKPRNKSVS